jgi:hypothetical protein
VSIELDPRDVAIGFSNESMERRALALIVCDTEHQGQRRVCERSTNPLPYGCWKESIWSPYARYGAERWCNSCIAYAALNGFLPKPVLTIEGHAEDSAKLIEAARI